MLSGKTMKRGMSIVAAITIWTGASAWGTVPRVSGQAAPADPDIVVKGESAHAVDTYVRQMTAPGTEQQLARWNQPVCIRVINLDPAHAKFITDRIAAIAHEAGVEVSAKSCSANALIITTTDPDGAVKQVREDYSDLFRFRDNGDRPDADYQELLKPRPVRWISGTETLSADGVPLSESSAAAHGLAVGAPVNIVWDPTKIDTSTREDIALSIAIVDANKLQGIDTAHLADYLAMVVLSHPRLGAPFKGSTIMAMFADRDAGAPIPAALTPMDKSLLKNLYGTANLRTADQQRASIVWRMLHHASSH